MISFSDRVTMASMTNAVSEREEIGAASSSNSWERLVEELDRLNNKRTSLEALSGRIDEYLSLSEQQLNVVGASSDEVVNVRDFGGDIDSTANEVYSSGY